MIRSVHHYPPPPDEYWICTKTSTKENFGDRHNTIIYSISYAGYRYTIRSGGKNIQKRPTGPNAKKPPIDFHDRGFCSVNSPIDREGEKSTWRRPMITIIYNENGPECQAPGPMTAKKAEIRQLSR
jgi:hypothetical protein